MCALHSVVITVVTAAGSSVKPFRVPAVIVIIGEHPPQSNARQPSRSVANVRSSRVHPVTILRSAEPRSNGSSILILRWLCLNLTPIWMSFDLQEATNGFDLDRFVIFVKQRQAHKGCHICVGLSAVALCAQDSEEKFLSIERVIRIESTFRTDQTQYTESFVPHVETRFFPGKVPNVSPEGFKCSF